MPKFAKVLFGKSIGQHILTKCHFQNLTKNLCDPGSRSKTQGHQEKGQIKFAFLFGKSVHVHVVMGVEKKCMMYIVKNVGHF